MSEPSQDNAMLLDTICAHIAKLNGTVPAPTRMRIQVGDVGVEMEWPTLPLSPVAYPETEAVVAGHSTESAALGEIHVRAPLVGTFYHAPTQGAPAFVRKGDRVQVGQQVGIVEAMKLMNPIVATEEGTVTGVLVADGEQVEYDEPLIALVSEVR